MGFQGQQARSHGWVGIIQVGVEDSGVEPVHCLLYAACYDGFEGLFGASQHRLDGRLFVRGKRAKDVIDDIAFQRPAYPQPYPREFLRAYRIYERREAPVAAASAALPYPYLAERQGAVVKGGAALRGGGA